jgi:signal transduction histidine kinase
MRAEEALGETEAARATIAAQAGRLQELDAAKTRFFGNISHEFRTPLTLIVGPLEDCWAGGTASWRPPPGRSTRLMLRNSGRLLRLINQILDLSKLEHGSLVLDVRTRDLGAFVGEVVGGFARWPRSAASPSTSWRAPRPARRRSTRPTWSRSCSTWSPTRSSSPSRAGG